MPVWDTIVVLDGVRADNAPKYSAGRRRLHRAPPRLALHHLVPSPVADIGQLAADIRNVRWELPADVRWMRFHPLGPSFRSPTITAAGCWRCRPFLTQDMVQSLGVDGPERVGVTSRGAATRSARRRRRVRRHLRGRRRRRRLRTSIDADEASDAGDIVSELDIEPRAPVWSCRDSTPRSSSPKGDDYTRLSARLGQRHPRRIRRQRRVRHRARALTVRPDRHHQLPRRGRQGPASEPCSSLIVPADADRPNRPPSAGGNSSPRRRRLREAGKPATYTVHVTLSRRKLLPTRPRMGNFRLSDLAGPHAGARHRHHHRTRHPIRRPRVALRREQARPSRSATLQAITSFLVIEARTAGGGRDIVGRTAPSTLACRGRPPIARNSFWRTFSTTPRKSCATCCSCWPSSRATRHW